MLIELNIDKVFTPRDTSTPVSSHKLYNLILRPTYVRYSYRAGARTKKQADDPCTLDTSLRYVFIFSNGQFQRVKAVQSFLYSLWATVELFHKKCHKKCQK